MKKIKPWIKSFRLSVTIPAGLLVHCGAKLAHEPTNWLLAIEIFFIASLAMIHNDYYDRENDIKKGRRFAYDNPEQFRKVVIVGWIVVWIFTLFLLQYGLLLVPVILISMFYSHTRKVMFLQTLCVAVTSASPVLIGHYHRDNVYMFIAIVFAIFAREIIKDTEDVKSDVGWKNTIISSGFFDENHSVGYAGALLDRAWFFLSMIVCVILPGASIIGKVFLIGGCALCGVASRVWMERIREIQKGLWKRIEPEGNPMEAALTGKNIFDLAMFCIILGMIFM